METESGAKIAIRGKGSVKEGKGKSDAAHASNQDEDLHCLIMADTEEKVNKAKKLIHNVVETVSRRSWHVHVPYLICPRQPPFLKARTSSNAISFVNWLHSTVLFATMKTKLARTAVKSATANTTVLSPATIPQASSVVSVAMLDTWRAIVRTEDLVQTGAVLPVLVAVAMR